MIGTKDASIPHRVRGTLLALALAAAACGGDASVPPAEGGIAKETFVAAYVELRSAAVRADSFAVSDTERAAILARHGVTEEDLLAFAEIHGEDVEYMRSVWDEVEARLDSERVLPDGPGTP